MRLRISASTSQKGRLYLKRGEVLVNLPNALTLARIFLVPFLMVFLIASPEPWSYTAGAIFLAAVFTDWLDGRIARRTRQVTTVGKLLDPIADKFLISAALISLVQVGRAPAWMVVLIVGRELLITGLRSIAASQGIIIQASEFGKVKMVTEVVAVTLLILDWPSAGPFPLSLGLFALSVAMLLAIVSGLDYLRKFLRAIDINR